MPDTIRVLIADDSSAVRDGLSSLLEAFPDFDVVGTAANGQEAVQVAAELVPDVILMDAQMPVMNGVEATKQIRDSGIVSGILFLSLSADYMEAALTAGADGFLLKDSDLEELLSKVRQIAAKTKAARRLRGLDNQTCCGLRESPVLIHATYYIGEPGPYISRQVENRHDHR